MKTKLLITGICLLAFGVINLLQYLPVSLGVVLMNRPFPFEHLHNVVRSERGTSTQIGYLPIQEAINDPYWLVWSLALYGGIVITAFAIWRIKK